jgi:hypothetical protein
MPAAALSRTHNRLRCAVFAVLLAFAADVCAQGLGGESEHQLKAGYVYHFAKLVDWPASVAPTGQPIVIGVLGNDAFAAVLGRVVAQKRLEDREFVVKRVKTEDLKTCGCRILFVSSTHSDWTAEIVQLQNSASVLTIAEAPDFARRGGIVGLMLDGRKVRLVVNVDAAARASLTISSRLLALATIVHTRR